MIELVLLSSHKTIVLRRLFIPMYWAKDEIDKIIKSHGGKQSAIISILQNIQDEYRYLPTDMLEYVSQKMDISPAKLFGIATFYENFSLKPKGKYVIKICNGTACHVKNPYLF